MDYKDIKKLIDDMGNSKLDEIKIEFPEGMKIEMKKNVGEKVFVNGKLCTSNSQLIKTGDIVSVRGKGRFKFLGNESESKKGRLRLEIWK